MSSYHSKSLHSWILITISLILFISCKQDDQESSDQKDVVKHPIKEKIPYQDNNHQLINTDGNFAQIDNKPSQLVLFKKYLENRQSLNLKKLDLLVGGSSSGFNVISADKDRLIILDSRNNGLYEYNLKPINHYS